MSQRNFSKALARRVEAARRLLASAVIAATIALATCAAIAQTPAGATTQTKAKTSAKPKTPTASPANPESVVATVGSRSIGRAEFESRYAKRSEQYRTHSGSDLAAELVPIARRQALEGLIQAELLRLEAQRRGLLPTEQEAEDELKRDPFFFTNGDFNQARFDAAKNTRPQQFAYAVQQIRVELGGRRLQQQLEREFAPPEAELRAEAEQELTRASVSLLALQRGDFAIGYAEPREADVLDQYRARRAEFMRPDRARLTIAFIDTPVLPDSERSDPAKARAWSERMRAQAQAALAAVNGGASLEEATADFGAPRRDIDVTRDHFPVYWRGDERLNGLVFAQARGAVLPEPVPAEQGWLLVRVEERVPAHVDPLKDAAPLIRADLRERARRQTEEQATRLIYQQMRDSLRTTAYRVRYAVTDTSTLKLPEPGASELERYYRAHLAEYSTFDPATTSVRARPFAEVKSDVRSRWMRERRIVAAREITAAIAAAWSQGKRDRGAESRAAVLRDVGPVVPGAAADTDAVGRAVGDSLTARAGALGVGTGLSPRGPMVFHVYQAVPGYIPTFEQVRRRLAARRDEERQREEERGAHALFDRDPSRFRTGDIVFFTRVSIAPTDALNVKLTRAEVERYHQEHIDRYSLPETMSARHILISPTGPGPEADEKARARAADLLRRIRAGEDFGALARQYSDDPPTRDNGGELGSFGRGAMLEEFERAAFSLRAGEVSDLVRTHEGYHIIQCISRESAFAQPLAWMYANVASDLARERARQMAKARADSLYLVAGTPQAMLRAATKLRLRVAHMTHGMGSRGGMRGLFEVNERLETMKPGEMYPGPHQGEGEDYAFSWVDSIVPARKPEWRNARPLAILAYRSDAGAPALEAKLAELDSLERRGFGFDSLGALWGGLQSVPDLAPGKGLPDLGGEAQADSLVFGIGRPPALAQGHVSGWLELPLAAVRLRLDRQAGPSASAVGARVQSLRRAALDRKLQGYFQELKRRYPVKILDPGLRDVGLPEPPAP